MSAHREGKKRWASQLSIVVFIYFFCFGARFLNQATIVSAIGDYIGKSENHKIIRKVSSIFSLSSWKLFRRRATIETPWTSPILTGLPLRSFRMRRCGASRQDRPPSQPWMGYVTAARNKKSPIYFASQTFTCFSCNQ